ncbi:MAG: hypothetical protein ABI378_15150 [Chitinophagaceae bacterium]
MTIQSNRKENIIVTLLLFLTLAILSSNIPGFEWDVSCWKNWTINIHQNGLAHAYKGGTDYMPLYQYVMFLFGNLAGSTENIEKHIGGIRVFTLMFDFAGIYLIYRWTKDRLSYLGVLLFTALNMGYMYNTLLWFQVDGIVASLFFAALFFVQNKRILWSTFFLVLALNMKLQTLALIPVWGLLVLFFIVSNRRWWLFLLIPLVMLATQFIILIPFGMEGTKGLLEVVQRAVGMFPKITLSADNIWNLLLGNDRAYHLDSELWAGLPFRQWGLILFFFSSFFALFPLLQILFLKTVGRLKASAIPKEIVWLSAALVALLFFFCNTEMHERYCHPALIFIAAYSLYSRRYWPYILFSIAYFLNLEWVLRYLNLNNYGTLLFDQQFVALLFTGVLALLFFDLFKARQVFFRKEAHKALI